jgi:hypothetical protein
LQLQWYKCSSADWCLLQEVDSAPLGEYGEYGVFVIWRPGDAARASAVLYVGRGALRQGIEQARRDPVVGASPGLRVTWASVDPPDLDAVAAYLYQQLRPLWGEVVPAATPQPVNLPLTA